MSASTAVNDPATSITFRDVLYGRRSVRSYKPTTITKPQIHLLLDAAAQAPSAMLEQLCRFVIIQDSAVLAHLSDRAKALAVADAAHHGNVLKSPGSAGDGVASPYADPEFNVFHDASTLIVICAKPTGRFVIADCWLAAENLMLAACAEGLGTCCIGSAVPALNTPASKGELGIPADMDAIVPIVVGEPTEHAPPTPHKLPVILSWIRS